MSEMGQQASIKQTADVSMNATLAMYETDYLSIVGCRIATDCVCLVPPRCRLTAESDVCTSVRSDKVVH